MSTAATRQHALYLFGRPKLVTASGEQVYLRPTLWRVVAVVAAGPVEGTIRSRVIDLVWPQGKPGTLRKALWDIREVGRHAQLELIEADGASLRLTERVYSDIRDLTAAHPTQDPGRIYRGEFLELADDIDHALWTAWLKGQRDRHRSIYIEKANAALSRADRPPAQAREALRLLEVDANNEAAARAQMLADADGGNLEAAQTTYHALRNRLEMAGRRPEEKTTDLYFRLRSPPGIREPDLRIQDAGVPSLCLLPPAGARSSHGWQLARSLVVDVTIGLCRTSLLKVTAPHTAAQIVDPNDLDRIATLKAGYAVTTDILNHIFGQEQIVFTLYAVASRRILWSEKVEVADELSVETYNILAAGIMQALIDHIDRSEVESFAIRTDPTSYVLFLRGQSSLATLNLPHIRRGRQFLTRAFKQSPGFAPTASAMARSYQLEWLLTARGDPDLLDTAELFARSAVEVDPYEARGFRELGFCFLYTKQFDRCLEQYERAERLSPQHADILADYADALVHDGQIPLALKKIERAISLNPLCQDTYFWTRGAAHFFHFEYDEAIASLEMMKDQTPALRLLAAAYAFQGKQVEASRCRIKTMEVYPDMTVEGWAKIVPFRDQRQIRHYLDGLRQAGFR